MRAVPRWSVGGEQRLIWRDWGDESVVFDTRSGETHLLDVVGREALKVLEQQTLDRDQLCETLARRLKVGVDEDLGLYIDRLIARLDTLGLIRNVS